MPRLRVGSPFWLSRGSARVARRRFPSLSRSIETEVAIVGGGTTGAIVAWAFASAGTPVVVLDAALVGRGSTAASTALLMQEPDKDFGELSRMYGHETAERIWTLGSTATLEFVRTLQQLKIVCDLELRDSIYYAATDEAVARLRAEHERRRAAGLGGKWLDAAELERVAAIRCRGAIRTSGNAQLDPYRACLGLLGAAQHAGARVFERSPARRIDVHKAGVRVVSDKGDVRAKRVVIATGYSTPAFKPLAARFEMKHTYVLATRRVSARVRRKLGAEEVMLWDTERPYHYARWAADGRLLLGGEDRPRVSERQRPRAFAEGTRALHEYYVRLLPALAEVDVAYQWEGVFANTPDGLPYLGPHRRYPRHLFALGYGGNGMTYGFLAARLLLEYHRGIKSPDQQLFAFGRFR